MIISVHCLIIMILYDCLYELFVLKGIIIMWEGQMPGQWVGRWQEPIVQEHAQYFKFKSFRYKQKDYHQLLMPFDRKKHITNSNLIAQYFNLNSIPIDKDQQSASLTIKTGYFRQDFNNPQDDYQRLNIQSIRSWILQLKLQNQPFIYLTLQNRLIQGEEGLHRPKLQNKNSQIIEICIEMKQKVKFIEGGIGKSLKDELSKVQWCSQIKMDDCELWIKSFLGKSSRLQMNRTIDEDLQYRIIEIRDKKEKDQGQPQKNVHFIYLNQRHYLNYHACCQYKLYNIYKGLGLEHPSQYILKYGSTFIQPNQTLSDLTYNLQQLNGGQQQLGKCRQFVIIKQGEWFNYILDRNYDNDCWVDEGLLESINEKAKLSHYKQSIKKVASEIQERLALTDQLIPQCCKDPSYYRSILAYTEEKYYSIVNTKARSTCLSSLTHDSITKEHQFIFKLTKNLQSLPYRPFDDLHSTYRGESNRWETSKPNDIIEFRNLISTTKSIQKAKKFAGFSYFASNPKASSANCLLYRFKTFSGRAIQQFSSIPDQQQVLICPYTPFLVKKIQNLQQQGVKYLQIWLQELPMVRNMSNIQMVWIGKSASLIIQHINQLRYQLFSNNGSSAINIDYLPFSTFATFLLWKQHYCLAQVAPQQIMTILQVQDEMEVKEKMVIIKGHLKVDEIYLYKQTKKLCCFDIPSSWRNGLQSDSHKVIANVEGVMKQVQKKMKGKVKKGIRYNCTLI